MAAVAAGIAMIPACGMAQVYGFPSEVGVIDDGYGTLPPEPSLVLPPFPPARFGFPLAEAAPSVAAPVVPCPLIIRVGQGLRHRARTRVTYGSPACSR